MLATERAVRYTRDGTSRRGSGLRIGGQAVLTADHCANGTNHRVVVGGSEYQTTVLARSGSQDVDVAILQAPAMPELDTLARALVDRETPTWLRGCQALGYPTWKGSQDRLGEAQDKGDVPTGE